MTDVANLEAAFERVTVTDENDEQISSNTTLHKNKVCITGSMRLNERLTMSSPRYQRLYP